MNFESPSQILTQISTMQWANQPVQANRARINRLFNGDPPWTEDERRANRIQTNQNFLEPGRIAANSRYQMYNAFFKPGDFFTVKLDKGPAWKRSEWSHCITKYINRELRRSKRFHSALESAHAQVVLHGPGPSMWRNRSTPIPETLGVDDVLVPAGTLVDMSNLDYLSIYRDWTWSQLYDMTHGAAVDKGWNKPYIDALLKNLFKQPLQPLFQGNRWLFPEKMQEDMKENAGAWSSSSMAKVLAWDFYFRDEKTNGWNRRILLDYNNVGPEGLKSQLERDKKPQFLYKKDEHADDWTNVIHWFIGNCSNVAPFRYYCVRSIGYLLYGVCLIQNRIRCRLNDHLMQSLLVWFRNISEDDRERIEDISLHHLGIFPDGVSMVTANERYTADWNLIMNGLAQNRQLMAESANSFLPDIAVEGDKPAMTATESLIRNNASVTLTSAVLNQLYTQAEPMYREICRRFCIKSNPDPMAKRFRDELKEYGVPLEMLDIDAWEIIPERVMGGGNKAVELTTARALFEIGPQLAQFNPQAQILVAHNLVLALTDDAQETEMLVPRGTQQDTSAIKAAANAFSTLMQGVPYPQSEGINLIQYISTLLELMALKMEPMEQMQSDPKAATTIAESIAGLVNVGSHIEGHIAILAQDPNSKEPTKAFQEALTGMMSQLKAYAERLQEMEAAEQEQQGGIPPEAQAKIISAQIIAQNKAKMDEAKTVQKLEHKDAAFAADQMRKDASTSAEINRKMALTQTDIAAKDLTTQAEMLREAREPKESTK